MEEKDGAVVDVDGDGEEWGRNSKSGRHGAYVKKFVYPLSPEIETQLRHSVREGAIGNCGSAPERQK